MYDIDFNRPYVPQRAFDYMREALLKEQHISGGGIFTRRCEEHLEQLLGAARVLLAPSCTSALEMSAILLDIVPGDIVAVPSFTFVSTINAFVLRGARPLFIDIHPDTLNMNEDLLREKLARQKVRAIIPVHYAGIGCAMDSLLQTAELHGSSVVEDNAHGLFGKWRDRPLGTFGSMATLSFHETKNISCGEGGALIINDPDLVARAEIVRDKGTDRSRFLKGQVDKYTWTDIGSSYVMSDLLAAVLWAQLEESETIQKNRKRIWDRYAQELRSWAEEVGSKLPGIPNDASSAYHMFYLLMPDTAARDSLIAHLGKHSILAVFHYVPLHLSPMGQRFGAKPGDCPITEDISARLVRLPFFSILSESEQGRVIARIIEWRP